MRVGLDLLPYLTATPEKGDTPLIHTFREITEPPGFILHYYDVLRAKTQLHYGYDERKYGQAE